MKADLAKLRDAVLVAPSMGDYFELPEDCRATIDELLAIAEAVERAPVVTADSGCVVQEGPGRFITVSSIALTGEVAAKFAGQRVRLLAIGEE